MAAVEVCPTLWDRPADTSSISRIRVTPGSSNQKMLFIVTKVTSCSRNGNASHERSRENLAAKSFGKTILPISRMGRGF